MNWFYEKDGEQHGPIAEHELKALVTSGELAGHNLIWREGMADWTPFNSEFAEVNGPASEKLSLGMVSCPTCGAMVAPLQLIPAGDSKVCAHCRDTYVQSLKEGVKNPAAFAQSRGTGGATPNRELRAMARESLSGNWGNAVVVTFLNALLQQVSALIPIIGALIQWAIIGPLSLGYHGCFLGLVRGEPVDVGMLFNGFSRFWQGLGIYFMTALLVGLASMAAAIPGGILMGSVFIMDVAVPEEHPLFFVSIAVIIIPVMIVAFYMYLRYALVYFIANDEPGIGVFDALKESTQRMNGHKMKLFCLFLSFIGWFILGFLAFFVGILWSATYMYAALAAFYDDLGDEA